MLRHILLTLLLLVSTMTAADLTLIQDSASRAAVIVAADEPKAAEAANELIKYLQQMSGATVPLYTEGATVTQPVKIYVGHTQRAAQLGVAIPAGYDPSVRPEGYDKEGYVIKRIGSDIIIGGNADAHYEGNFYAVHAFLESLGCRWYFPGDWGEVIPTQKTITIGDYDIHSTPDFSVRRIWISGWVPASKEERAAYNLWGRRIGFNFSQEYPLVGDGFLAGLLDPNDYFEEHPEYYAMNKAGERKLNFHGNSKRYYFRHTMLCLSNPEVYSESVKNLKLAFDGKKDMRIAAPNGFGISPPDGAPFCYCEDCLEASQNFNYPRMAHERQQSDEYFAFVAKLANEFPDKYVASFAYALREVPPQGVTLPKNVAVKVAPISCCVLHTNADPNCWRRKQFMAMLTRWHELSDHITLYDYNPGFLLGLFIPERSLANMTVDMPIYRDLGMKGFTREGRKAFMQTWISYYANAKQMWDADTDIAALKQDFYTTFFGPAGPHVQAWWDANEAELEKATVHIHEDWLVNHIYTVEYTQRIHAHVVAAQQAATAEPYKSRVAAFALIADHLEAYAAMEEADKQLDYPAAALAGRRMWENKKKLFDIYSFFTYPDNEERPRPYFDIGRAKTYEKLAAMTDGTTGTLVAELPLTMRFSRDLYNAGVHYQWFTPDFDDSAWDTRNTFVTWDQQEEPMTPDGHDYDGHGWYRGDLDIPAERVGKPLTFYCGGAINEAWVWVNGQYAGHKKHTIWWHGKQSFEVDITKLVKPGKNNITIRIYNDAEIGGLYRRGFVYAPKQ